MCLEGNRGWRGPSKGGRNIILFNLIPLHPLPLLQLKNALCKIHVFYVLTCCFCLQRDPFSSGDSIQCWGGEIGRWKASKEIKEAAIGGDTWSPLMCLCIYCFKVRCRRRRWWCRLIPRRRHDTFVYARSENEIVRFCQRVLWILADIHRRWE